jgi:DNA-binding CsgD family transcriptional regulator
VNATDPDRLSGREGERLAPAAVEMSDCDISAALQIPPGTVGTHMRGIRMKLDARNRTHAVARALNAGVIGLPAAEQVVSGTSCRIGISADAVQMPGRVV